MNITVSVFIHKCTLKGTVSVISSGNGRYITVFLKPLSDQVCVGDMVIFLGFKVFNSHMFSCMGNAHSHFSRVNLTLPSLHGRRGSLEITLTGPLTRLIDIMIPTVGKVGDPG